MGDGIRLGTLRNRITVLEGDIRGAKVILGVDVRDESNEGLFFGESVLRQIFTSDRPRAVHLLWVPIDFDTDDPEVLAAACVACKGSCCYRPSKAHRGDRRRC